MARSNTPNEEAFESYVFGGDHGVIFMISPGRMAKGGKVFGWKKRKGSPGSSKKKEFTGTRRDVYCPDVSQEVHLEGGATEGLNCGRGAGASVNWGEKKYICV